MGCENKLINIRFFRLTVVKNFPGTALKLIFDKKS